MLMLRLQLSVHGISFHWIIVTSTIRSIQVSSSSLSSSFDRNRLEIFSKGRLECRHLREGIECGSHMFSEATEFSQQLSQVVQWCNTFNLSQVRECSQLSILVVFFHIGSQMGLNSLLPETFLDNEIRFLQELEIPCNAEVAIWETLNFDKEFDLSKLLFVENSKLVSSGNVLDHFLYRHCIIHTIPASIGTLIP